MCDAKFSERCVTGYDSKVESTGKGRPTPSRKEAEAARRQERKPQTKRGRNSKASKSERALAYERMKAGDPKYLHARDQGPVRRFARDFVDRRFTILEVLLPLLILVYLLSVAPNNTVREIGVALWGGIIVAFTVDTAYLVTSLKREAKKRFPDENRKGIGLYATMRATQIRRWRVPNAQVKRGEKI